MWAILSLIVLLCQIFNFLDSSSAIGELNYLTISNPKGYVSNTGRDVSKFQLEISFNPSLDSQVFSSFNTVQVNCSAIETRLDKCKMKEKCFNNSNYASNLTRMFTRTITYEDYHFINDIRAVVWMELDWVMDCFSCNIRLCIDRADKKCGRMSEPLFLELPPCSRIKPRPSLQVLQTINDEEITSRCFDMDVGEDRLDYISKDLQLDFVTFIDNATKKYIRFDEFYYGWTLQVNSNKTCLIRIDLGWRLFSLGTAIHCVDYPVGDIACYGPKRLIFYTKLVTPNKWHLVRFDKFALRSETVVGSVNATGGCNRFLSHGVLAIDWRPFWRIPAGNDGHIVFISSGLLWSYDTGRGVCVILSPMINVTNLEGEIFRFDLDWFYFYWINSSTSTLHTLSLIDGNQKVLLSEDNQVIKGIVDIITFGTLLQPQVLPIDCLVPDVTISVTTSDTTANVTIQNVWKRAAECSNNGDTYPKVTLDFSCEWSGGTAVRDLRTRQFWDRRQQHHIFLDKLTPGVRYTVGVKIKGNSNDVQSVSDDLHKFATYTFSVPASVSTYWPWWPYLTAAVLFLILATVVTFIILTYRRRSMMKRPLRRHRIDASQLTVETKLGSGQFGDVFFGHYTKSDGQIVEVALKVSKSILTMPLGSDTSSLRLTSVKCFFQEAIIFHFLCHKNITEAYGVCTNLKFPMGMTIDTLVLEYMNGGSAIDYVKSEKTYLRDIDLLNILLDVCKACQHLTHLGIIHRDIGARNVLVRKDVESGKPIIAKLTDFGLARDVGKKIEGYQSCDHNILFNMRYTAPEGFDGLFSSQSDIWSFGVFIWEVFDLMDSSYSGSYTPLPYSHLHTQHEIKEALQRGYRLELPSSMFSELCVLTNTCWALQPKNRPQFNQLAYSLQLLQRDLQRKGFSRIITQWMSLQPETRDDTLALISNENDDAHSEEFIIDFTNETRCYVQPTTSIYP